MKEYADDSVLKELKRRKMLKKVPISTGDDLFGKMEKLLHRHVKHWQGDFLYDKELVSQDPAQERGRVYVWMLRSCGTWIHHASEICEPGFPNSCWNYYAEVNEEVSAFAVHVKTVGDNGKLEGEIFKLEYPACLQVLNKSVR